MCRVWKNGIFWRNYDNITTVIELLDNNRCVLVAMSCDDSTPVEHAELRSSLIALVRHLQQQYCPRLNVCEFLISPDLIQRYPLDNLPDSNLFGIHHLGGPLPSTQPPPVHTRETLLPSHATVQPHCSPKDSCQRTDSACPDALSVHQTLVASP